LRGGKTPALFTLKGSKPVLHRVIDSLLPREMRKNQVRGTVAGFTLDKILAEISTDGTQLQYKIFMKRWWLLILVADMLVVLIFHDEGSWTNHRFSFSLNRRWIIYLILFIEYDLEQAENMKLFLCTFKQLSGLKINFHKTELFYYGEAKYFEQHSTQIFGCATGECSFKYLGIPMPSYKDKQ
jgi:hypothetical protein